MIDSIRVFHLGLMGMLLVFLGACSTVPSPTAPEAQQGQFFQSDEFVVVVAQPGDTPQTLAGKYLGDPTKAWMIEDYNNETALVAGQQVVIPKTFWKVSGVDINGYQLVPILVYHNLGPQPKGRLVLGAKAFEDQMRYLKAQGYHVVGLKQFLDFVSLKQQLPKKSVVLTFDDGYKAFLQYAYPILKELDFTATLFVYTDYIGMGGNALTWQDLKRLASEGFEIQAHSKSHGDMRRANGEPADEYTRRLTAELVQPRELFQKNLGYTPDILAYPFGRQDDTVVQRTRERGYGAAFTVLRQGNPSFVERLRIHRSQIYSDMSMDDFIKNLNTYNSESLK